MFYGTLLDKSNSDVFIPIILCIAWAFHCVVFVTNLRVYHTVVSVVYINRS